MGDEREGRRENEEPQIEGHLRRANEPGADAENDDPQAREGRRENEEPETEGHYRMRANEPGPDAENADAQTSDARRENEEPGDDAGGREGHMRRR